MRTLRVVAYVVNGSGVGHLVRAIGIVRWLTRYAAHAGVRVEAWFLTSSEADALLFHERFASFKLPSKTAAREAGIEARTHVALAKQWVWHSLGLLRPDLLLVDTFPRGAYGELLSALDLARRRVFVYRPVKDELATRADFQAMLPLYDLVAVPEHEEVAPVLVPDSARDRLVYAGPVMARERAEMLPREAARAALGVAEGKQAVLVTAGGGGDPTAEAQLARTVEVCLARPEVHVVIGAGPLYRGRPFGGDRVTVLAGGHAAELMSGVDLAVSAAGYNTFGELMHAGVPTVFVPQQKGADDQAARAERAGRAGAAIVLEQGFSDEDLDAAVGGLLARGEAAREAARAVVPRNHARDLAAEVLRLLLPPADVDAAEDDVSDELLAAAHLARVDLSTLLGVGRALGDGVRDRSRAYELALRLFASPAPRDAVLGVAELAAGTTAAERARGVSDALEALAPFDDWPGALRLARAFSATRNITELVPFVVGLRGRGEDLARGLARLSGSEP